MNGFTKLWSEILSSSIWNEGDKVRLVWITMLAAMGPDGMVRASVGGLAHLARVDKEACEEAIGVLSKPDPDSRSTAFDGRRIERVEGGFLILNGAKYREARSHDERKVYMAEYMKEYRRKQTVNNREQNVNRCKPAVDTGKPPLTPVSPSRSREEAEADKKNTPLPPKGGEPSAPVERKRNFPLEALAELDGHDPKATPPEKWQAYNKILAGIKVMTPEVTPDEIHRRAKNYRLNNPTWTFTVRALASHWQKCDVFRAPRNGTLSYGERVDADAGNVKPKKFYEMD